MSADGNNLADQWNGERILASACKFLGDGGENELAALLATGALEVHKRVSDFFGIEQESLDLYILAPRPLYEVLESDDNWSDPQAEAIHRAISAVLPPGITRGVTHVRAALLDPPEDWRSHYGAERPRATADDRRAIEP